MLRAGRIGLMAIWCTVCAGQDAARSKPTSRPQKRSPAFIQQIGQIHEVLDGDRVETIVSGGVKLRQGGMEVRAERGIIVFDRDHRRSSAESLRSESGLPRRGFEPPPSRRAITEDVLRARMSSLLRSFEGKPSTRGAPSDVDIQLVRSFYVEGGVTFVYSGREVVRAERVFVSVVDNRVVFEDVEMRLYRFDNNSQQVIVVRSDKLTRQGVRFTGRDISVTTCDAGEPHFEIFSGEAEIIERADEFEIRSRDNWLAFSGRRVLPLPDATHFTGSPSNFYVKGARAAYSDALGALLIVDFGAPMNEVGGAVHEFITGRPGNEFRGDWRVATGIIQERGIPFDSEFNYRADDLYYGRTRYYNQQDRGQNLREIQGLIDGTTITNDDRQLLHTENRLFFNDTTSLDLTAFRARDPAVWSEFFIGQYIQDERPETTAHLRHATDNYSLQAIGRWNLNDFSYGPGRDLAPRFVESQPNVTFDLISEEIAELPGDTPLLLTSASSVGQFRSNFDDRFAGRVSDSTTRIDQELELAAPVRLGDFGMRAFASARFTHVSDTPLAISRERWAFNTGVSFGTRLSRTWRWSTDEGREAVRHVMSPTLQFSHRFKVDGDPTEFHQFDRLDALDEDATIRLGLLQRFQRRTWDDEKDEVSDIREFLWIDLAQNFKPISDRDNGGDPAGLFEFELIVRPNSPYLPLDDLALMIEGEHDWARSELRTFNTYTTFNAVGMNWFSGYRADQTERGTLQYGATLPVRGRWSAGWNSTYDFELKETLTYVTNFIRRDHDWQIMLAIVHDNIVNETRFTVDFVPDFGGIFRQPQYDDIYGGFRTVAY